MEKVVIENSTLKLLDFFEKVSIESKKEKLARIELNRFMYWWTRKPLSVGKAVVLASTLENFEDLELLMGKLNGDTRNLREIVNSDKYIEKLGRSSKSIKVLDPFGGSGNLIFPAVELGLDVSVSDYNPLAYLIQKAILEFPAKYGDQLIGDFEKYAQLVIEKTKKECGQYFNQEQLSYLWCWCIKCPHCGQRFPLTNHMYIVKKAKKKIGIKISVKNKDFTVEIVKNISNVDGEKFTQKGGKAKCIACKNSIDWKTMTADVKSRKDREMIVIQIIKDKNKEYIIPSEKDFSTYQNAVKYFNSHKKEFENDNLIPKEIILPNRRREMGLWHYGIKQYDQYFDERQILVLISLIKNIKNICSKIKNDEYRSVIALYLSAILSKRVDAGALGAHWNTTGENAVPALAFREPRIIYNFVESNPFSVNGSLQNSITSISKAISFACRLKNKVTPKLESVNEKSNSKYDLIITDPPYGDDVQYGELSEFFYVWIYRLLKDYYPEIPSRAPLDEDICESWGRFGDKKIATEFFAASLKKGFQSMSEKLKNDGIIVIFFAHSSTRAWNIFLESIRASKLKVISSYAIHTEMTTNLIARGNTSFMSSIVVTCRKITKESSEYFEDIIPQIEDVIKNMMKQIPDEKLLTIPITDLLIMVYGKVLEVCTQHTVLKSYQKDFNPDFETLIKDARSFIMKELVAKLTGKSINTVGPRMAFYLLIKIFHKGIIAGDDAIKIAQTYDVDINELEKEQVVTKDKDVIRLYYLNENEMNYSADTIDKNDLYQQLCYLAYTVDSRGSEKIPGIISKDNFRVEDLKQIISLLIKNSHLRRNKGETLVEKEQRELKILETLADITGVKIE